MARQARYESAGSADERDQFYAVRAAKLDRLTTEMRPKLSGGIPAKEGIEGDGWITIYPRPWEREDRIKGDNRDHEGSF